MCGRRPLLHNVIPSWWSPPTFNPLLRQLERAPAFPALRAVSKDTWCQCLLKPQLKFIFRDHLCIQAEGIPGTVGSLRHPICSNHVHHKSWTMSVRLTLHSLAGSPLRHIKYFALSANKSSWYFHLEGGWKSSFNFNPSISILGLMKLIATLTESCFCFTSLGAYPYMEITTLSALYTPGLFREKLYPTLLRDNAWS